MCYTLGAVAAKQKKPRGIDQKTYEGFVELCREGVSAREAAERMGTARKTATRAYNEGWPNRGWPAAKEVVEDEQLRARAAMQEAKERADRAKAARDVEEAYKAQEQARKNVVQVRREEAEIVRGERANVMALMGITGQALRGAMKSAQEIERMIREGRDSDGKPLSAEARVNMLWKLGRLVKMTGDATYDVIKAERLLLGEPTAIIGHRDLEEVTEEQAIEELIEAGEVGQRMARRRERRLMLLQGGGDSEGRHGDAAE